ncbi:hydrogenase subunit MbhD domain-containing protein [Pyrococcus kukulkanii]|uniref:DUF4040 domain-containing protein n=1 Tax=Pyrococcus kukulkanii TaxID=1609559 RepID=A0A127B999_9EURY|nr:hydrogenase subunit MbhD domain-containing protein [Pyrococcus kukulkanii]AMM53940.1 sodium:proton antiporter [Pyrococcus kukulkanii]
MIPLLAFFSLVGLIMAYLAVTERDLIKAVGFSALQAIAYAGIFYLLMAPDIVLAYVAISVGIYTALLVFVIMKTGRYEVS